MLKAKNKWQDLLILVIGNILLVVSVRFFVIPFNILSGGVAGVAIALSPFVSLEVDTIISLIILGTFVLGAIFLGREFTLKTILSSILYPILLQLFMLVDINYSLDPILASLYSGVIGGIGIGMVFRTGASTGGMDIPPLIIHKFTGIKVSTLVLITDALTILLGLAGYGIEQVLIGLISVFSLSFTLNKVLVFGGMQAKTVFIISDYYHEIIEEIHTDLNRGTTLVQAKGGYTDEAKPMILSVIDNSQYLTLQKFVERIDPNAFLIVWDATEVKGEGFSFDYKI